MYMMLVLKLPIVALFLIVRWAIKAEPELEGPTDDEDGGSKHPHDPRGPSPRRRGPHGDPVSPAPARTRTTRPQRSKRPA